MGIDWGFIRIMEKKMETSEGLGFGFLVQIPFSIPKGAGEIAL